MPYTPNPQNSGGSNPYTYNIGTSIGSIGGGYIAGISPGAGNININASNIHTLSVSTPRQIMTMKWIGDSLQIMLLGEENNQFVNLELTPERDITPLEQLRITTLITSISSGGGPSTTALLSYVRRHHLERHFKFSAA